MSNGLDPDQDLCSVGPAMGPNCLQSRVFQEAQNLAFWRIFKRNDPLKINQCVLYVTTKISHKFPQQ